MVVGIFGSSGYLGQQSALICKSLKIDYVCLDRSVDKHNEDFLKRITQVIDCGFPRNYYKKGLDSAYLLEIHRRKYFFESLGSKYIYIGTFTGVATRSTHYSQIKQKAEEILETFGATILRTGLIVSQDWPGGRYRELGEMLEKFPISLIPNENWFPLIITDLDDFLHHLGRLLRLEKSEVPLSVDILPLRKLVLRHSTNKMQFEISSPACQLFCWAVSRFPLKKLEGLKAIAIPVSFSRNLILDLKERD
jgi:hypothetical protein